MIYAQAQENAYRDRTQDEGRQDGVTEYRIRCSPSVEWSRTTLAFLSVPSIVG